MSWILLYIALPSPPPHLSNGNIYINNNKKNYKKTTEVSTAICRILLCAVIGARALSLVFEDGIPKLLSDPLSAIFRPGFWLHGGIAGAGIGIVVSRESILRPLDMVTALGLSLPLYEAFSRLGCHSYGCCFGRPLRAAEADGMSVPLLWRLIPVAAARYSGGDAAVVRVRPELRGRLLFPVQRISAVMYALVFGGTVGAVVGGWVDVGVAGWVSLVLHAVVRLVTEGYREDFRGGVGAFTATGALAGVQMVVGVAGLIAGETGARRGWDGGGGAGAGAVREVVGCAVFAFALGFSVYGYNFRRIGVWVDRK